jgi:hypothetical protein
MAIIDAAELTKTYRVFQNKGKRTEGRHFILGSQVGQGPHCAGSDRMHVGFSPRCLSSPSRPWLVKILTPC